jgi:hypothetical protein
MSVAPAAVGPNFICRPYRGVSVQDVEVPLDAESLRDHLIGRPVYRRTEFLVACRDGERAVVELDKEASDQLFAPVTEVRHVAGPSEVVFLEDDRIDTANATQMAAAALGCGREAHVYVVQGISQHVNFIVAPAPVRVRVVEVVPPDPPKLLEMARRVIDFDENLPPIELELVSIDLRELAAEGGAERYLFPCRCASIDLDVPVDFLDAGPPHQPDWTLVGCERSRQIHEFFYGESPPRIDFCPKVVDPPAERPTLMKCCLLERGLEQSESRLVVPWGASLDEVREALGLLTLGDRSAEPAPAGEPA